jgi:predicted DNA-binding transcriptional regulator YafY
MYHPTTRLLTVLELLQTYEQISSTELAQRLEVDARTVRKYIMMLQDMGIPVEAEMGRYGGYSLRPGFKLPPMMFTNEEAFALILGLLVVRHLGLTATSTSIEGAMVKLNRVLPDGLRNHMLALQNTLVFDIAPPKEPMKGTALAVLGQGAHDKRQVIISYRTEEEETTRTVDPYSLIYHNGQWYLVGYCHLRVDMRVFRLDRISEVKVRTETFAPPENFNSLEFLIQSIASMPDRWNVEVILKTTLERASSQIPRGMGTLEQHPDGVLFCTAVPDIDWMARFLVGLGCPVVVCQPPELRTAFEKLAAEVLQFAKAV